jgi:enamine deaminase RidA (YjgF/YER057c/UK114 family)
MTSSAYRPTPHPGAVPPCSTTSPGVINGRSDLLVDVLGERGRGARSAVGLAELPFDICVEIEAVVLVD